MDGGTKASGGDGVGCPRMVSPHPCRILGWDVPASPFPSQWDTGMRWDGRTKASGRDGEGCPSQSHLILVGHWDPLWCTLGDEELVGCPEVPEDSPWQCWTTFVCV